MVAWTSDRSPGSDTDLWSVQAQRYAMPAAVPSLSPAAAAAVVALLTLFAVVRGLRRRA